MDRTWRFLRAYGLDLLIALAALGGAVEVALAEDPPEFERWLAAPAIAVMVVALLLRRRLPFAAPALVWLIAASLSFADGGLVPLTASATIAGLAAAFLLGRLPDTTQGRLGLAIVVGGAAIISYNDPGPAGGELIFTPVLFAIGWIAGYALRERGEQAEAAEARAREAERDREAAARVAVAEERARIARELHDIVAHSVSVMVLQVGSVRHQLPDERADHREALEGVERTGRTALAEMRRLLGAMRTEGEEADLAPQPGLDGLDALLEQVGRAGLEVRLEVEGERRPLPRGLDLSAYRIVQEGLTNALKHARAKRADVLLRYGPGELEIEVRNDGDGRPAGDGGRPGYGLVGVGERVKVYGGEMSAQRLSDGGFLLSTRLPLRGEEP
ncbi:MAG: histidine kinase [Actinomycetota bacterium]|nr:histidine kinase [Actinomycetota bacterium]